MSALIDKLIPIYHRADKKRHDLLVLDLSRRPELNGIDVEVIDQCIKEIETIIFDSRDIAMDMLYGRINHHEAIKRVQSIYPKLNLESLEILLERANHLARR